MAKSKKGKNRRNHGNASAPPPASASALARRNHGNSSSPPPASASASALASASSAPAVDSASSTSDLVSASSTSTLVSVSDSALVSAPSTSALVPVSSASVLASGAARRSLRQKGKNRRNHGNASAPPPASGSVSTPAVISASSTSALLPASGDARRSLRQVDEETLIRIFSNLPVSSLLRFISVSKKWGRLILSPEFAFRHVSRSPFSLLIHVQKTKFVIIDRALPPLEPTVRALPRIEPIDRALPPPKTTTGNIISVYTFADQKLKTRSNLERLTSYPGSNVNPYVEMELVGSAYGILLIGIYPGAQEIHFWNPATRESLAVPPPRIGVTPQHRLVSLGLGCDSSRYEFKVIRILSFYGHLKSSDQFEWFSSKTKQWKGVKGDMGAFRFYSRKCDAVVNGIPYWRLVKYEQPEMMWSLVRFDLQQNAFIAEVMPNVIDSDTLITEVMGSIGMVLYDRNREMDVWVKKADGTWNKVFRLGPTLNLPIDDLGQRPLAFYGDGGIVDEVGERGNLILYDPKEKVVDQVEDQVNVGEKVSQVDDIINVGNSKRGTYSLMNYKGSLVSLKPRQFSWQKG